MDERGCMASPIAHWVTAACHSLLDDISLANSSTVKPQYLEVEGTSEISYEPTCGMIGGRLLLASPPNALRN